MKKDLSISTRDRESGEFLNRLYESQTRLTVLKSLYLFIPGARVLRE